jgi:hypothetical protein
MLKYKIPQIVTLTPENIIMLLWIYFRKEMKKELSRNLTPSFLPVGVTGFEPATTRPPEDNFKLWYFYICLIYRSNIAINQMLKFYNFSSIIYCFSKNVVDLL